ncbi:ABC transporter permease [Sphingobacterium wenxiniae]|uniref:ABC-type antimicrobial peptide transport system, permease component n=1 Tax=Sphingobacterium wenxiniae TaxID=683125 RepID=A0A1I6TU64_9SPHI|nr:ABC transporter permease [Sphingobacterium wenxiniae]SFS92711.1 ABC-type antimicrobial peptide transport system, permease component [Sphingobacterium wenxiniae]
MIKNYFKTTLRYLWRNKLFTVLNIVGLSIGISACWMVFSMVHYEFSFDKEIPELTDIYQIVSAQEYEGKKSSFAGIPLGMPPLLADESLEGTLVVPIYSQYIERFSIPQEGEKEPLLLEEQSGIVGTRTSYFDLLPYEWLAGNAKTAFADPNNVVLTTDRAKVYFPKSDPADIVGKVIMRDTTQLVVSGVVKNLPFPSSFNAQVFMPIPEKQWSDHNWMGMNSNHTLYVKAKNKSSLQHLLDVAHKRYKETAAEEHLAMGAKVQFGSFPLVNKHFERQHDTDGSSADIKVIYGLIAIGGFLLILACINYINLSTAQVPQRAREIGVRKTLGARPVSLTANFMVETLFITSFALLLSWPLVSLFQTIFPEFMPKGIDRFDNSLIVGIFLFGLLILISFFAGLYPAYLINRVRAVETLKGKVETKIKGTRLTLRKSLIVFQFIIAQFFIVSALIIGQQLDYTLKADLGFVHDAIVNVRMPYKSYQNSDVDPFLYKQALEKYPEIAGIALGHEPQSNNHWGNLYYFTADTGRIQLHAPRKYIDKDYIDLYQIELLAGRNILQTDTMRDILVNEATLKALGLQAPEQIIGQHLIQHDGVSLPVVGVFKDFHQKSLRAEIEPLLLGSSGKRRELQVFHIKLPNDRRQWKKALATMEKEWTTFYPNAPFEYKFADENIKTLYETEHRTAKLIDLATGVTIFISCLGLFGLATLTAFQRTKEIGIRKVLGASVAGIVGLLSKDFVKLVLIAIVVASPIAWWAMNEWLADFAYRIPIQWWMFMLAGLLAVLVALLTVSYQAIRAARTNPVNSLRDE